MICVTSNLYNRHMGLHEEKNSKESRPIPALQTFTLVGQGVVFGSLFQWACSKRMNFASTRTLGWLSIMSPFLLIDPSCCKTPFGGVEFVLFALHLVFSFHRAIETKFEVLGPWNATHSVNQSMIFPLIAFLCHFQAFLKLFLLECRTHLWKRTMMIASFHLGAMLASD